MSARMLLMVSAVIAGVAVAAVESASAQDMPGRMAPGMMPSAGEPRPPKQGMMQGGGMGQGMMCPMMRSGMKRGGMMHGGMMHGGMMGPAMMGSATMSDGMAALFGSRVTPVMNLSVDDVRGYLDMQLKRLNNKRLKVGDVKSDDSTVTADIVTVDNSLVQRLKVDRHAGTIIFEN